MSALKLFRKYDIQALSVEFVVGILMNDTIPKSIKKIVVSHDYVSNRYV